MGLSFRRLLLFEGLFEVASLGAGSSLARFLSSPLSVPKRRREKDAPSSGKPLAIQPPEAPLVPAPFSKSPQALLRLPPANRKAEGQAAAFLLFQSARGLQESGCCLSSGPPQPPGKLRSQKAERHGGPGGTRGGGWPGTSGTGSAPPLLELIHKYRRRARSGHSLRLRRPKHRN